MSDHRTACHRVAYYMMRRLRWCDLAAVEVAGRGMPFPEPRPHADVPWSQRTVQQRADYDAWRDRERAWRKTPAAGGGQLDVLALTLPGWKPRVKRPKRIAAVEVKVTRSDLLGDLRRGKLLRYEPQATHCYLAATGPALGLEGSYRSGTDLVMVALHDRGLPSHWGVIAIPEDPRDMPITIRKPTTGPHACQYDPELVRRLAVRAAVSMAWRTATD